MFQFHDRQDGDGDLDIVSEHSYGVDRDTAYPEPQGLSGEAGCTAPDTAPGGAYFTWYENVGSPGDGTTWAEGPEGGFVDWIGGVAPDIFTSEPRWSYGYFGAGYGLGSSPRALRGGGGGGGMSVDVEGDINGGGELSLRTVDSSIAVRKSS